MRLYIDNKLAFWGAVIAFLGSAYVTLDRFTYFHEGLYQTEQWKRVDSGLKKLNKLDRKFTNGSKYGFLEPGDAGFAEITNIILLNKADFAKKRITEIIRDEPVSFGSLPIALIQFVTDDSLTQATPVSFEYVLFQWISAYRTEIILRRGFALVTFGFLLGIVSRVKRKPKNEDLSRGPADSTSGSHG